MIDRLRAWRVLWSAHLSIALSKTTAHFVAVARLLKVPVHLNWLLTGGARLAWQPVRCVRREFTIPYESAELTANEVILACVLVQRPHSAAD
jgi:hypothetical protein